MATRPPHCVSPVQTAAPLRLMIVDDSIVARMVFQRMLTHREGFEIVAVACSAKDALVQLETVGVDIILLDLEMPGTDGLTALPDILAKAGGARVLIVSSACAEGAAATLAALTLGAADTLLKPSPGELNDAFADRLADRLRRIGRAAAEPQRRAAAVQPVPARPARRDPVACLAIGASTGGLHALSAFFGALPASFRAPILVTQHLPAEFMPFFAAQVATMASRPASVARDGELLAPGHVFVASGEGHLSLARIHGEVRVRLDRSPAASGCQPSVDPMLTAVAEVYGGGGVAVVLSGMGRDGVVGAGALARAGGEILVQDAATATIWGMPGAVAKAGIADAVLPPDRIGRRVGQRGGAV